MQRVLVAVKWVHYPLIDASRIRVQDTGKILAQRYEEDLLAINEGEVPDEHLKALEGAFNKVIA